MPNPEINSSQLSKLRAQLNRANNLFVVEIQRDGECIDPNPINPVGFRDRRIPTPPFERIDFLVAPIETTVRLSAIHLNEFQAEIRKIIEQPTETLGVSPRFERFFKGGIFEGANEPSPLAEDLTLGLLCFEETTGGFILGIVDYHFTDERRIKNAQMTNYARPTSYKPEVDSPTIIYVRPYPNEFLARLLASYELGRIQRRVEEDPVFEALTVRNGQNPTLSAEQVKVLMAGGNPFPDITKLC